MEQQTLSIAKAGIVCKLNCRTTIIAVTNPVGGIYDHDKSFCSNVGISAPLLSRFDLIFKLIDSNDEVKDDNVATFLLNRSIQGVGYGCSKKRNNINQASLFWSMEKLRAYIATVKSLFHPTLTSQAGLLLQKHYETCRLSNQMALCITIRCFESLIRLAQAHARLMFRDIVNIDDVVSVILLMESSVATTSSDGIDSFCMFQDPLNSNFPMESDADWKFLCDKVAVLTHYNMSNYLTDHERNIISQKSNEREFRDDYIKLSHKIDISSCNEDHYGRMHPSQPSRFSFFKKRGN